MAKTNRRNVSSDLNAIENDPTVNVTATPLAGDLPVPTVERVALESMQSLDNVRESAVVSGGLTAKDIELLTSLSTNGQAPGHFLTVSIREDGTIETLAGNRRRACMWALSDQDRLNALFTGMDPKKITGILVRDFSFVECLVYRGLTKSQEDHIRADHVGNESLSKWDKYRQVIQLWEAGLNSRQIEGMTGVSHGVAERYRYIREMDPAVEQEFYDQCHGKPGLNLTFTDRNAIHVMWIKDLANSVRGLPVGHRNMESNLPYADSDIFRRFGPISEAKWQEYVDKYEASLVIDPDAPVEPTKARRSTKNHEDNAFSFKDAPFTSGYAKWAAGDPNVNLNDLYRAEIAFIKEHARLLKEFQILQENHATTSLMLDRYVARYGDIDQEAAALAEPVLAIDGPAADGSEERPLEV